MKYVVRRYSFSFTVIATIVTGHIFAESEELKRFAELIAGQETIGGMMEDRKYIWAPWLIVQIPSLAKLPQSFDNLAEAEAWLRKENKSRGRGRYVIKSVKLQN